MKKLILPLILAFTLFGCTFVHPNEPDITDKAASETVSPVTAGSEAEIPSEISENDEILLRYDSETAETEAETETETIPEPEKGYVYLTFDDGPGKYTERVLEILDDYDVKATFFVVGIFAERHPERLQAIYEAGHDIGCHSNTHAYSDIYGSGETMTSDILAWEKTVEDAIGTVPEERLYRYPGGSNCTAIDEGIFTELHEAVNGLGYRGFDWSCANNDRWYAGKSEEQTFEDFLKESAVSTLAKCRSARIMLLHETVPETVDMLPWLIEYLLNEGYGIATLSQFDGEYLFPR